MREQNELEPLGLSLGARSRQGTQFSLTWQRVLEMLQVPVGRVLPDDRLYLFELDKDPERLPRLILQAATCEMPSENRIRLPLAALERLAETVEAPLLVDPEAPGPDFEALAEFVTHQGCGSMVVVVAIRHQDTVWGCLIGASPQPRTPDSRDLCVYSLLASCLAVSVESASLRAETSFRFSGAMSLQTVVSALVEEHSLDAILSVIIDETIQLLGASDALVLLIEEGEEWFQVSARTGSTLSELRSTRMSMKDSLHGLVAKTGEPLVSNDAFTDPRANQARARKLRVHTVAIAPLKIRHQTFGTLAVHNKQNGFFSPADVEILCSFANQAAVAIDNAKLFRQLAQARDKLQEKAQELQELLVATINIQEDERRRIAADIHDRVISRIVGALYEVESCCQRYSNAEDLGEQLQMLKDLLDEAIEKTRNSIYDLWPVTLDHMGLVPALRELCSRQQTLSGIHHYFACVRDSA